MFASIIAFALVGTAVAAQVAGPGAPDAAPAKAELSERVRIDSLWSSFEFKYRFRRVTLPVAHATMHHKAIYFAAPQIPTPIVSLTTIILVTLMEAPQIVAIRSLVPAAVASRAEVVVQMCSLNP